MRDHKKRVPALQEAVSKIGESSSPQADAKQHQRMFRRNGRGAQTPIKRCGAVTKVLGSAASKYRLSPKMVNASQRFPSILNYPMGD